MHEALSSIPSTPTPSREKKEKNSSHSNSSKSEISEELLLSSSYFCLFLGKDGEYEDLLNSSSISTLLDAQGFSDIEKSPSSSPVMGSPSRDPFNTSIPEEVFTECQYFLHVEETLSLKHC